MSYARLRRDVSEVYVYAHTNGKEWVCSWCQLSEVDFDFRCGTPLAMHTHLMLHRARGQLVPDSALELLQVDAEFDTPEGVVWHEGEDLCPTPMPAIFDCGCSYQKVRAGFCTIYDYDGSERR